MANNLERIEAELIELARPFVGAIPEVAAIIEKIERIKQDASAENEEGLSNDDHEH
jgi:hypothetical protein